MITILFSQKKHNVIGIELTWNNEYMYYDNEILTYGI